VLRRNANGEALSPSSRGAGQAPRDEPDHAPHDEPGPEACFEDAQETLMLSEFCDRGAPRERTRSPPSCGEAASISRLESLPLRLGTVAFIKYMRAHPRECMCAAHKQGPLHPPLTVRACPRAGNLDRAISAGRFKNPDGTPNMVRASRAPRHSTARL